MVTKGYGLSVSDIDESCPSDLQPYAKAYDLEGKQRDYECWMQWGAYGIDAISTAVLRSVFGRRVKYREKPLLNSNLKEKEARGESQEEIAVFEMMQRTQLLEKAGLPQSPD